MGNDLNWDVVAEAVQKRMDALKLHRKGLAEEAKISELTLRKLLDREQDSFRRDTLVKLSTALGWGPDGIFRIGQGEDPDQIEREVSRKVDDFDIYEMLSKIAAELDRMNQRLERLEQGRAGSHSEPA